VQLHQDCAGGLAPTVGTIWSLEPDLGSRCRKVPVFR
jgi:hypothetical protein